MQWIHQCIRSGSSRILWFCFSASLRLWDILQSSHNLAFCRSHNYTRHDSTHSNVQLEIFRSCISGRCCSNWVGVDTRFLRPRNSSTKNPSIFLDFDYQMSKTYQNTATKHKPSWKSYHILVSWFILIHCWNVVFRVYTLRFKMVVDFSPTSQQLFLYYLSEDSAECLRC